MCFFHLKPFWPTVAHFSKLSHYCTIKWKWKDETKTANCRSKCNSAQSTFTHKVCKIPVQEANVTLVQNLTLKRGFWSFISNIVCSRETLPHGAVYFSTYFSSKKGSQTLWNTFLGSFSMILLLCFLWLTLEIKAYLGF